MSFFKDFKDDFSQAVNELMSMEDLPKEKDNDSDMVVNTLEQEVDAKTELDKLEGLLEKPYGKPSGKEAPRAAEAGSQPEPSKEEPQKASSVEKKPEASARGASSKAPATEEKPEAGAARAAEKSRKEAAAEAPGKPSREFEVDTLDLAGEKMKVDLEEVKATPGRKPETVPEELPKPVHGINNQSTESVEEKKEDIIMNTEEVRETNVVEEAVAAEPETSAMPREVSDEVTVITEGTAINGNLQSTGSIEVRGKVTGNVECNGKLTVTGMVKGNSNASEFFADAAKIEGEINTEGTVKVGLGSIVIGNITATSAVIAGAIKGDIDVQGPVVVDTSAVVMGNIKSRSVQINNGAVIEGFCSQCYAEVDVNKLFEE